MLLTMCVALQGGKARLGEQGMVRETMQRKLTDKE